MSNDPDYEATQRERRARRRAQREAEAPSTPAPVHTPPPMSTTTDFDALIAKVAAFMWEHHPRRDETMGVTSIEFWSEDELRQRITFAFDEARWLSEAEKRRSPTAAANLARAAPSLAPEGQETPR